ncbi:MAG: class I SAM-dependent methyltransferase [Candidatus Limnocylindrales bacterium]
MDCCDNTVYDDHFDAKRAEARLLEYRRNGPRGWTARLIGELSASDVTGLSVLDIGAGVGAVHHALLAAGAASAVDVDASGPYLEAARGEAVRRGLAERVTYLKGDAVALAAEIGVADLVALDRVVCCYPDMEALVGLAAARTRRRLGIVLPRDVAWARAGITGANCIGRLGNRSLRTYAHRIDAISAVAAAAGLALVSAHRGWLWQTLVFERPAPAGA